MSGRVLPGLPRSRKLQPLNPILVPRVFLPAPLDHWDSVWGFLHPWLVELLRLWRVIWIHFFVAFHAYLEGVNCLGILVSLSETFPFRVVKLECLQITDTFPSILVRQSWICISWCQLVFCFVLQNSWKCVHTSCMWCLLLLRSAGSPKCHFQDSS